jgi:hypothetical protein
MVEELAMKCNNRECYHCSKKFAVDHKCVSKGVLLLELDDNMEECEVADNLGIALHALTSINIGNTMKLRIVINGTPLLALMDTKSTHTFIQEAVVFQLGLQVEVRPGLLVMVANGE